ncbi:hypothetical protein ACS0TY_015187 [Phlomoides rotata]
MLFPTSTLGSTGRTMSRHGSTSLLGRPDEELRDRKRAAKGFSLEEQNVEGIAKKLAPTIGIFVDHCRRNNSLEGF